MMPRTPPGQRGFAIVTAIFLIVVMALLGAFAVGLTRTQSGGEVLDQMGARGLQAAQAGLEWGAWQVRRPGVPVCNAATTLVALPGTLAGWTVIVNCQATAYNEAGVTVTHYLVTSTACTTAVCPNPAPGYGYVERRLMSTLER